MLVPLAPGGPYYGAFPTPVMPGSVEVSDTFTASALALRNGVVDASFALTVTQPSPGYWSVYGTVPVAWNPGDSVAVFATLHDSTHSVDLPILVDVILLADPKLAALVAIAEAKAKARAEVQSAVNQAL